MDIDKVSAPVAVSGRRQSEYARTHRNVALFGGTRHRVRTW